MNKKCISSNVAQMATEKENWDRRRKNENQEWEKKKTEGKTKEKMRKNR